MNRKRLSILMTVSTVVMLLSLSGSSVVASDATDFNDRVRLSDIVTKIIKAIPEFKQLLEECFETYPGAEAFPHMGSDDYDGWFFQTCSEIMAFWCLMLGHNGLGHAMGAFWIFVIFYPLGRIPGMFIGLAAGPTIVTDIVNDSDGFIDDILHDFGVLGVFIVWLLIFPTMLAISIIAIPVLGRLLPLWACMDGIDYAMSQNGG